MDKELIHKSILLFDGDCNLCNATVQFILKHEKKTELRFASLQSETGVKLLKHYSIDSKAIDSLVFIEKNRAYIKSSAALRVSKYLKGVYPLLFLFIIIPGAIRNLVYDYIARNRYKWFGKSNNCMLPNKTIDQRFL